jgi:hypothetical protein
MLETSRLLDTATRLSHLLLDRSIPHAFYGSVLSATLANSMYTTVGLFSAPLRPLTSSRKYSASSRAGATSRTPSDGPETPSPEKTTGRAPTRPGPTGTLSRSPRSLARHRAPARLHVTYRAFIPPVEVSVRLPRPVLPLTRSQIEILPAGETGPRHLDDTNVMKIQGIPFLNVSEFLRAKLKAWMM